MTLKPLSLMTIELNLLLFIGILLVYFGIKGIKRSIDIINQIFGVLPIAVSIVVIFFGFHLIICSVLKIFFSR